MVLQKSLRKLTEALTLAVFVRTIFYAIVLFPKAYDKLTDGEKERKDLRGL